MAATTSMAVGKELLFVQEHSVLVQLAIVKTPAYLYRSGKYVSVSRTFTMLANNSASFFVKRFSARLNTSSLPGGFRSFILVITSRISSGVVFRIFGIEEDDDCVRFVNICFALVLLLVCKCCELLLVAGGNSLLERGGRTFFVCSIQSSDDSKTMYLEI